MTNRDRYMSKTIEICRCPEVCQLTLFLSQRGEAYSKEIMEMGISNVTVYRVVKDAAKYGLITSKFVASKTGGPRRYYSLTEKGKRQAEIIKECNDHLLSK
jgi:DNA-binding PadR family transcriptional regulator